MAKQDEERERERHAEELRREIDRLRENEVKPEAEEDQEGEPSPRDFVEKRMRELGEEPEELP